MDFRIEHYSLKGDGIMNEDAMILNDKASIYGVLDGATSVIPFNDRAGKTGGYVAAHTVKEHFETLDKAALLREELAFSNELIKEEMIGAGVDVGHKENLWATAAAIVSVRETEFDYVQIADCMIYTVDKEGEINPVTKDGVKHIDNRSKQKWQEGIHLGLQTKQELRGFINQTLIENRQLCNCEGGYGALNGEKEAEEFIASGSLSLEGLQAIIILSDGFMSCSSSSEEKVIISGILRDGLEKTATELHAKEESDPNCLSYVRLKTSDDKTGIVIRFEVSL